MDRAKTLRRDIIQLVTVIMMIVIPLFIFSQDAIASPSFSEVAKPIVDQPVNPDVIKAHHAAVDFATEHKRPDNYAPKSFKFSYKLERIKDKSLLTAFVYENSKKENSDFVSLIVATPKVFSKPTSDTLIADAMLDVVDDLMAEINHSYSKSDMMKLIQIKKINDDITIHELTYKVNDHTLLKINAANRDSIVVMSLYANATDASNERAEKLLQEVLHAT